MSLKSRQMLEKVYVMCLESTTAFEEAEELAVTSEGLWTATAYQES